MAEKPPMIIRMDSSIVLSRVPAEVEKEISARLRFINPKWAENDRLGRWNHKTPKYLVCYEKSATGKLLLPRGYIRHLILFCREKGIPHEIDDRRRTLPEIDFTFCGTLKPFQQTAVNEMMKKEFGILSAPTGSGKTVIALSLVADRRQPALIVVHTKELAFHWVERIRTFLDIPAEEIGMIGAGSKKPGEKITVALIQSLYRNADLIADKIGYLIVDECHRTPSRTFTEGVTAFDSRYMLGLTATPFRRDKLSRLIYWHLGDLHHTVDRAGLQDQGDIVRAIVVFRHTEFKPFFDPTRDYSRMLSELTADDERNRLIAGDIYRETREHPGVCLVLSDRKKHCENLRALLKYRHKIDSDLLTGDMNMNQRKAVLERLEKRETEILVATGQLIGEGFDCPDLSTLFMTTPIKFSGRLIQYLGRILRPAPGKELARVFDYVDLHVGPLQAAADSRMEVYRQNRILPE